MNGVESPQDATSAGATLMRHLGGPVVVGCMLTGFDSSTASSWTPAIDLLAWHAAESTTAGAPVSRPDVGPAIGELRRLSGLTWDQLARLLGVSRRSLHFWASGKPMTPRHEERLQRLLAVIGTIDRGSASATRAALLGPGGDGLIPFDLLAAGDYDRVSSLLGAGGARQVSPPRPSKAARAARAPQPPEALLGALQDRIHRDVGGARPAKSMKVRGDR